MMSLEMVEAATPKSVRRRFFDKCGTVKEALVCCEVARAVAGSRAALNAAMRCFSIPVQYGDVTLEDMLWWTEENILRGGKRIVHRTGKKIDRSNRFGLEGKPVNRSSKYHALVFRYLEILSKHHRLPQIEFDAEPSFARDSVGCWWEGAQSDRDVFPRKFRSKDHKINIRFDQLWRDVRQTYPDVAFLVGSDRTILEGCVNDEASAWLIWMCGAFSSLGPGCVALCRTYRRDPSFLKELNTNVKASGAQSTPWGCSVCELNTLAGRGVGGLDMENDVRTRINRDDFLREKAAVCDPDRLRRCIRSVIADEMVSRPVWPSKEDYWSRRWLYTKSGSHSRRSEERWFSKRLDLPPQPTRREFSEAVEDCLVAFGEPRVDAGFSQKEEHGKTRAIYGCDTVSYFTFDYLLRPIEAVWANKRVLLDPGRRLQSDLYAELASKKGIRYMLDFDDFNSQHTLDAMRMVIEEVCKDAPEEVLNWAVESWGNMHVYWGQVGEKTGKMVGTLPSGHRATTFVNTILNAAYCRLVAGDDLVLESYHCGDDVVTFGTEYNVSQFVNRVTESAFRINPAKQSVGFVCGEFLRVAFTQKEARGYGARAVSSIVSGNWVTDNRLDKKSYTETLVRGAWTINSRFKTHGLGTLFVTALSARVPELTGHARKLLEHELSWGGSPVSKAMSGDGVVTMRPSGGLAKPKRAGLKTAFATKAFMANHVDFTLLAETDYSPAQLFGIMVQASEKPREVTDSSPVTFLIERSNRWYQADASYLARLQSRRERSSVEALNLLAQMLTKVDWQKLAGRVRGVNRQAILGGKSPWPVICPYTIPFSDAMNVRDRLTVTTALVNTYPVRV